MVPSEQSKITEIVNCMLIMSQKNVPVKKADISKMVSGPIEKELFRKAESFLSTVYGYELVEIDKKGFILVNQFQNEPDAEHIKLSNGENERYGFIMLVLSLVFMNGGVLVEETLYQYLTEYGIKIDQIHDTFGDVKRLLQIELVRECYLEYTKIPNSDPQAFQYSLGARVFEKGIKRRSILEFVARITDTEPENWQDQYNQIESSTPDRPL